jgi:hypothetical protein
MKDNIFKLHRKWKCPDFDLFCANFGSGDIDGRFVSYDLEAWGDTLGEALDNAVYWQVDQDGESLGDIRADDDEAVDYITEKYLHWCECTNQPKDKK